MADATQRIVVYFTGRVQGVGFRYRTHRLAAGLNVTGTVENLDDGRVRLVAEGAPDELKRLIAAIEVEMGRLIVSSSRHQSAATGEFTGFSVRH